MVYYWCCLSVADMDKQLRVLLLYDNSPRSDCWFCTSTSLMTLFAPIIDTHLMIFQVHAKKKKKKKSTETAFINFEL
uniref:Uncharacterized protein n=1 Tax=Rhizophora mucronata TaxID=61149 RepID=A0A2P2J809_RHIMU